MAKKPDPAPPSEKSKPALPLSPRRIVSLVVLVLALGLMGLECRTRMQWSGTRQDIGAALAEGQRGIYRKGVSKYLRGAPTRKKAGPNAEVFTWNGLLKSYHMRLDYTESGLVKKASWY